jgi:hypothetical protein
LDVALAGTFVHDRSLTVERFTESFGVCHLPGFAALGRFREAGRTVFHGQVESGGGSAYAGKLGVLYFNDGVMALDAAGPAVALTGRSEPTVNGPNPTHRLVLSETSLDGLPVTSSLHDEHGVAHRFQIATGTTYSYVYLSSLEARWPRRQMWRARWANRTRKTIPLQLRFPNGDTQEVRCYVLRDPPEEYISQIDTLPLTGSLGVDLLRAWIQVFDFPRHELQLYDYAAVED